MYSFLFVIIIVINQGVDFHSDDGIVQSISWRTKIPLMAMTLAFQFTPIIPLDQKPFTQTRHTPHGTCTSRHHRSPQQDTETSQELPVEWNKKSGSGQKNVPDPTVIDLPWDVLVHGRHLRVPLQYGGLVCRKQC